MTGKNGTLSQLQRKCKSDKKGTFSQLKKKGTGGTSQVYRNGKCRERQVQSAKKNIHFNCQIFTEVQKKCRSTGKYIYGPISTLK